MKKRTLVWGMIAALSMTSLMGCGPKVADDVKEEKKEQVEEKTPNYFEENDLELSALEDFKTSGLIVNVDTETGDLNYEKWEPKEASVKILDVTEQVTGKEGYKTVAVTYETDIEGEARFDHSTAQLSENMGGVRVPSMVLVDLYTGELNPEANSTGDTEQESTITVEHDGKSYEISVSKSIFWDKNKWETTDDPYLQVLPRCEQVTMKIVYPEDYDGLVLMMTPTTDYDAADREEWDARVNSGKPIFVLDDDRTDTRYMNLSKYIADRYK